MTEVTTDDFLEALAAKLVSNGIRELRLNDQSARDSLTDVYSILNAELSNLDEDADEDEDWVDSVIEFRNMFIPSPIGAFDELEASLRAKQAYLINHPNPYYDDLAFRMSNAAAHVTFDAAVPKLAKLIELIVPRILRNDFQHG